MNSRLVSVAAEEGFRVSDLTQADEVLAGDVAAVVIWLPRLWADPQGADTLKAFLESGGRVLCLYDYDWADQMGSLAELLGVSVIQESVAQSSDSLVYPEEMLPPWLSGLSLGIDGATVELSTYLVASSENGTTRYLVSRDSGEKRLVYYSTPDHSVTFFPKLSRRREESRTPYAFFGDRWFHLHENERGGMAMLQYLVED